jgi:hypothetical protein
MVANARFNGTNEPQSSTARDPSLGSQSQAPQPDPFAAFSQHAQELRNYFSYYVAVRADQLRLKVRQVAVGVALGAMGALAGASVIIASVVLLLVGIAGGLGELFGGRPWLGSLVTGLSVLVVVTIAGTLMVRGITMNSLQRTVQRYVERRHQQRRRFGEDVGTRAQARRD